MYDIVESIGEVGSIISYSCTRMTSVLRRYSLIDVRAQNMVILFDCSGYKYQTGQNIPSAPVMTTTDFASAYQQEIIFREADMVKDLGRFIHVYDTSNSNNLVQVFRQVMLLQNGRFEGITSIIAYICTWSADGISQAVLARIG